MALPITTGSTRHDDRVNQFEHVCVERCPLTTRHTAIRSGGQLRERVSYALSNRVSAELQPGGRSGNTVIQSRRVHDRGKPSRAKPDERLQNVVCGAGPSRQRLQRRGVPSDAQKWTTRGTSESTTMPTTRWPTELWDH